MRIAATALRALGPALALLAAPAFAADHIVPLGSFDTVRVLGPFRVTITTGRSPGAIISGDRRAIDGVEVRTDGDMLVVREANGGAAPGESRPAAATIALTTPNLIAASVIGAGALAITGARGARVSLSVSGPGTIALTGAAADEALVTVIGAGSIAIGGRVGKARLSAGGAGSINAAALDAGDLIVTLGGPGTIKAHARYTARVGNSGLGEVSITGPAKCTIQKTGGGGPVNCGKPSSDAVERL